LRFQDLDFDERVDQLVRLLTLLKPSQLNDKGLTEFLSYAEGIPEQFLPTDFVQKVAQTFSVDEQLIEQAVKGGGKGRVVDFDTLVPKTGWLRDYIEYTRETEPPTVFHFFAGLVVLGSTIARRVYFPRGNGNIFPNICAVLVAPAGMCKKTTACNLAVNLFRRIGGNVLADKVTPEALIESFKTQPTATGLIYAPEWAVFLGKQQYLEGLVPMLTALFDCPDVWSSSTLLRGQTQLTNVAISHLAATTIDWMQSSITKDAFAGGFMSRLLFVVQKDSPRSFPLPPPLDQTLGKKLVDGLLILQRVIGEVKLTPTAEKWYRLWYTGRSKTVLEKQFAGYFERKPDRILQLAMVLNAAQNPGVLDLDVDMLILADKILNYIEHYLPAAFEQLAQSAMGDDQLRLLSQLRAAKNGELGHSEWLRKNTSKMNAVSFKQAVDTLIQAGMVAASKDKKKYYILPAGRALL
jgi:hypothetical protein